MFYGHAGLCNQFEAALGSWVRSYLPTHPNFFEHVTPNTYMIFFGLSLYEKERKIEIDC